MIIFEASVVYSTKEIPAILIENSEGAVKHLREHYKTLNPTKEHVVLMGLNRRGYVKFIKTMSSGTSTNCLMSPKEIFTECLLHDVSSFIVAHNHPTGISSPSQADTIITRKIREASHVMDITFHDHIILGIPENDTENTKGFYSYRETGLI